MAQQKDENRDDRWSNIDWSILMHGSGPERDLGQRQRKRERRSEPVLASYCSLTTHFLRESRLRGTPDTGTGHGPWSLHHLHRYR